MSVPDELSLNDRLGGSLCQAAVFLERDDREVSVKAEGGLRLRSRETFPRASTCRSRTT